MNLQRDLPIETAILATGETGGGVLYGMVDMLSSAGNLWPDFVGTGARQTLFQTQVVSNQRDAFRCANGVPIIPDYTIEDDIVPEIVVVPEIWRPPERHLAENDAKLAAWLRKCHRSGSLIYSSCTGAILLAASGILDGRAATSHWAYKDYFSRHFDAVNYVHGSCLVTADPSGRIVTASGSTSWQDLALHIIARHCGAEEALRIAKGSLLRWHEEGQKPYAALVQRTTHEDCVIIAVEDWLGENFQQIAPINGAIAFSGLSERTLKRRFKRATGSSLINRIQCLRVEEAKRRLELSNDAVEEISVAVGYDNTSFFGRLFKRLTGVTPGTYRRMFQPVAQAGNIPFDRASDHT